MRTSLGAGIAALLLLLAACGGGGGDGDSADDGGNGGGSSEEQGENESSGPELPADNTWAAEARVPVVNVYDTEEPAEDATPIHELSNPNENQAPLTFLVDGADVGGEFVEVYLPVQPNGSKGWIRTADVTLRPNPYHIRVELGAHRLSVTNAGQPVTETDVAVGQTGRETPTGTYYLKELLQPPDPNTVYGPYAYGLSGFTNNPEVAEEFGEGGVVGIHGNNDPSSIGQNVSSGCIRLPNDVITEMAGYLPLGTPVEIVE
jgi:lipoprotein-anchoring transpeptidase ErfK/SrfK